MNGGTMIRNTELWTEHAPCRSVGVEVFFPEPGEAWLPTATMCRTSCPVQQQCLDYAMRLEQGMDRNKRFGVWGGLTPSARMKHEPAWLVEREAAA
jgi:hypothetical protein